MTLILPLLMLLVVFICVALLFTEGLWGNAIRLINVITAALLASNYFEPVARMLDGFDAAYTYVWDFLSLWLLFIVIFAILNSITDQVSKVRVKFLRIVDRIGGSFFAFWIGWVMVCFTMMTLHTAPLARDFLFGGFQPQEQMISGLAPDRQWLAFVQKESMGSFCRSATEDEWKKEATVFDPRGEFILKYATRRKVLESLVKKNDSILSNSK